MKKSLHLIGALALIMGLGTSTYAVELLISGDFETPGGAVGKVPGWQLQEFLTGSSATPTTASITGGDDAQLFLQAFAAGGPLTPTQGNFNSDGLPAGNVDGRDFLIWQRNHGRTDALPADGDATGDMIVNGADLARWQSNYGTSAAGIYANARLLQTVPAVAGETYTFQGTSTFEEFYSGFVTTLGDASPHGQIPSPTVTQFKMEFLSDTNAVLDSEVLDLRPEQTFPGFPVAHTPLSAVAPAGTVNVRVVAEALNMAWNGSTTQETPGQLQSAFFNDFILNRSANPGENLLTNGDLNAGIPDALDFWNQVETPTNFAAFNQILRTPVAAFSNHTPGGTRGVWLSAFFGAATNTDWPDEPVSGIISQEVLAVPGATYTFSGWTKFEANYSGGVDTIANSAGALLAGQASPTETEIRVDFLDIDKNIIESAIIDVRDARRLLSPTMNANDNQWYQHVLQAVAPAGTIWARLTAQMVDGVFNTDPGQSAFFDDFSLDGPAPPTSLLANVSVPEPSAVIILGLGTLLVGLRRN